MYFSETLHNKYNILLNATKEISKTKDIDVIQNTILTAACQIFDAEGAAFIQKEIEHCYSTNICGISPLKKGSRFRIDDCVSGLALEQKKSIQIEDISVDSRISVDIYESVSVKSIAAYPIDKNNPIGAVEIYWTKRKSISNEDVELLEHLIDSAAIVFENVNTIDSLNKSLDELKTEKEILVREKHELKVELKLANKIVESSPSGFDIVNSEGLLIYVNKTYVKMWGYDSADEIIGTSPVSHCADPDTPFKIISELKKNKYINIEFEAKRKDGSLFYVRMFAFLDYDKDGNEIYYGTSFDITGNKNQELEILKQNKEYESLNEELRQTNEELFAAKELAEKSDRLKTVFLNNMSHEVRTPMNGIMGFSAMLDKPGIDAEKRKHYVSIINNSCNQLLRIIDDILEISQLETNQIALHITEFNLNYLLKELFSVYDITAKERKIHLYLKKGLPDIDSQLKTDKSKLIKILGNILENALKFTNEGFVEFGYYLHQDKIVFFVKDTGIGIAADYHEIIFNRFVQEEKTSDKQYGGLGIGLSIAKENTALLNGKIAVESEKGKGAVFYVSLPYTSMRVDIKNAVQDSAERRENHKGIFNILIVEDEEVNHLFIEILLKENIDYQFMLFHAKNGKEAVEMCEKNRNIDLVLMDIKMPIMDGYEATEIIKSKFPDLPVIAQTAYSTERDKNKALAHGCNDFISKPINEKELFKIMNKYLKDK